MATPEEVDRANEKEWRQILYSQMQDLNKSFNKHVIKSNDRQSKFEIKTYTLLFGLITAANVFTYWLKK